MRYTVTVIMPVYNEEKYIEQVITDIINQDYPSDLLEVLFVDGGSIDNTKWIIKEKCKDLSNFKLIHNPYRHVSYAVNIGTKEAKGEIIILIGSHASYPSNYISVLVSNLISLQADNVGVSCITDTINKTPKANAIKKLLSAPLGVGDSFFRIGTKEPMEVDTVAFGCYKKETLIKMGGFNDHLIRNQDIEFNKRLKRSGGKIYLIPEISFTYYAREDFKGLAINNFNNGRWNIVTVYITKHVSSLSLRHFVPLLFILSLVIPVILGFLLNTWFLLFSAVFFLLYNIVVISACLKMHDKSTRFIYLYWGFYILHFSYGIGSFCGLFSVHRTLHHS
ncbi:MAG: glycosyltransferase family 2 protein [Bacteroidetes bacterium]|nr:glycosyltransferase family 2 protein [Bacteroidota bacterium]